MMPDIHLYQIAYNSQTLAQVQASGFLVLDNLANARPDWYEYWSIRNFLQSQSLDEHAFYGFFSPKFTDKTQMMHADVCAFVRAALAKGPSMWRCFRPNRIGVRAFLMCLNRRSCLTRVACKRPKNSCVCKALKFPWRAW